MSFKFLDAVLVTGASSSQQFTHLPRNHTVQITMGGTVVATAVTVDLEGSLDGITWFTLASHVLDSDEITAEGGMFHVADKLVRYIRLNLVTLTGGTAPSITAMYEASRGN